MHRPFRAPTLEGEDVTLRAPLRGDEDDVLAQCRDELTQRWTCVPLPYERRDAARWVATCTQDWPAGRAYTFAVEHDGRFAGSVTLRPDGVHGVRVGYGLAPWARGSGLARSAVVVALDWAFEALDAEVALWSAIAGNWPGRRVAWSAGFRVEGTVRGLAEQRGVRLDTWVASMRRGDPLTPVHPWYDPPTLNGQTLNGHGTRLRRHHPQDVSAMVEACNDPDTQFWLAQLPRPYTRDDARAHLEEIAEEQAAGRAVFWALVDPATDELRGEIGLWGLARGESRSAELGYWMHPAARGRGLTTEGVRLAARFALLPRAQGGLGLTRLVIRAADGNTGSQKVALGAGFQPAGRDRRAELLRDGTVADLLRYDVLPGEAG
jgi:RimJ/RimL family protein N-acetyltransferase